MPRPSRPPTTLRLLAPALLGLLALLAVAPATDAHHVAGTPDSVCHGYPVGWSGYYEHCVNPHDPDCLVSTYFWSGADAFYSCTGV